MKKLGELDNTHRILIDKGEECLGDLYGNARQLALWFEDTLFWHDSEDFLRIRNLLLEE